MEKIVVHCTHANNTIRLSSHKVPILIPGQLNIPDNPTPAEYQMQILDCIRIPTDDVIAPEAEENHSIQDFKESKSQDVVIEDSAIVLLTMTDPLNPLNFTSPAKQGRGKDECSSIRFNTSAKSKLFRQMSNKQNQSEDAGAKEKFVSKTSIKKQTTPSKIQFQSQLPRRRPIVTPFKLSEMVENLELETPLEPRVPSSTSILEQTCAEVVQNIEPIVAQAPITLQTIPSLAELASSIKHCQRQNLTSCFVSNHSLLNSSKLSDTHYQYPPIDSSVDYPKRYSFQCKRHFEEVSLDSIRPSYFLDDDWRQAPSSFRLSCPVISQPFSCNFIPEQLPTPSSLGITPRPQYQELVYQQGSFNLEIQEFWIDQLESSKQTSQTSFSSRLQSPKLQDFTKGKRLGKGMYGQVFVVQHKHTGFVCAMKVISKQFVKAQNVYQQLIRQLKIHTFMDHPNIVSVYGFFCNQENVYILQQLCTGGQLFEILVRRRRISERKTAYYIKQMVEAVGYIHYNQVIHRDIKPENILLQFGAVKIGDFGWAQHSTINQYTNKCGTPLYLSPEMVRGQKYTRAADNWGIGLVCYELIVGNVPWSIWTQDEIWRIAEEYLSFPDFIEVSPTAQDFIQRILTKYPQNRLSIWQMGSHQYLSKSHPMDYHNQMLGSYGEVTP